MAKSKSIFSNNISVRNKQASFHYELLEKHVCGIVLTGTEIKSVRMGKVALQDSHCFFSNGELYMRGLRISPYGFASFKNHDPDREKKLLLKKNELVKLEKKVKEKGLTIAPVRFFINDRGLAKAEIALARGKKVFDKRESLKEKDQKRDIQRNSRL